MWPAADEGTKQATCTAWSHYKQHKPQLTGMTQVLACFCSVQGQCSKSGKCSLVLTRSSRSALAADVGNGHLMLSWHYSGTQTRPYRQVFNCSHKGSKDVDRGTLRTAVLLPASYSYQPQLLLLELPIPRQLKLAKTKRLSIF